MNGMVVLLLFLILAVCILGVLLMGADTYRGLTERNQAGFERRTAAQYIAARLHQGDQSGAVFLRDFSGESSLTGKKCTRKCTRKNFLIIFILPLDIGIYL